MKELATQKFKVLVSCEYRRKVQAFTESAEELVGDFVDFTSTEHECDDFSSDFISVVCLASFVLVPFMKQL